MKPKKPTAISSPAAASDILLYQTEDGQTRVECRFENENVWLTQALMAELFQTTPQNMTLHLAAIYAEGELAEAATCKDHLQVRTEGGRQVKRTLREGEITELNRVVTMFLDFAEDQAKRRKQVFLRDWRGKLDGFLTFNERRVLPDSGCVSREQADRKAQEQYALFEQRRRAALEAQGEAALAGQLENLAQQAQELKAAQERKPKRPR